MHVAFALMISVPAFVLVRNRLLKALWAVYPAIVTLVVMVTANHFWLDAAGALVAVAWLMPPAPPSRVPAGRLGLAHGRRQGARVTDELRERPRRGDGTARPREAARRVLAATGRSPGPRSDARPLAPGGVEAHPNAISITGLVGNIIAAVLIVENHFVLGGIAFILGSVCDMLDGRYSRMSGKGSPFGAFLDSTLDRVSEGIVLTAVAAYFAQQQDETRHGRHCAHRGRLLLRQLHTRAGRGARRRVQGGDSFTRRPGSDPLDRLGVRR